MIVLDEGNCPVDRVAPFIWKSVEHERMTTTLRLYGKLIAYLPCARRSYYAWTLVLSYRPAQQISVYQFSPSHLRVMLFARWEFGLILGSWLMGLRLGQPLVWLKRLQSA
jgi:hypothetical protein